MTRQFAAEEEGVTTLEYGLIAALVVVGAIVAIDRFGDSLQHSLYDLIEAIGNLV